MHPLSSIEPHLLPLLDGTRDNDALLQTLLGVARQGQIRFTGDDTRSAWEAELRKALVSEIDTIAPRLTTMKLSK